MEDLVRSLRVVWLVWRWYRISIGCKEEEKKEGKRKKEGKKRVIVYMDENEN